MQTKVSHLRSVGIQKPYQNLSVVVAHQVESMLRLLVHPENIILSVFIINLSIEQERTL